MTRQANSRCSINAAAIPISLRVSLGIAKYLGTAPNGPQRDLVRFFGDRRQAFFLLIGAAPNAIAYESKQFPPPNPSLL
jgi:solute carrier family 13 (sodium-dependent dicarboxylate transporter), member 2/3/5